MYYVYIITNKWNSTLYIGVTNDLIRRISEHKEGIVSGFSKRYKLKKLVYFEIHNDIEEAIKREKQMKEWQKKWKNNLIEEKNGEWKDLYDEHILKYDEIPCRSTG